MSSNKTIASDRSVDDFIASLADIEQARDSRQLVTLFQEVTGEPAILWGDSIIGFGSVRLTYASGRVVDWMKIGFSPRKGKLVLYVTHFAHVLTSRYPKLGTFKVGKGCIYIRRLSDVDIAVLKKLIHDAAATGYEQANRSDGNEIIVSIE